MKRILPYSMSPISVLASWWSLGLIPWFWPQENIALCIFSMETKQDKEISIMNEPLCVLLIGKELTPASPPLRLRCVQYFMFGASLYPSNTATRFPFCLQHTVCTMYKLHSKSSLWINDIKHRALQTVSMI